ncbi:putative c6 zinc finger protein [Diaporthe ampelina]|uniref:Putative c6 zinc finger protein n=1 Tax=Diaporthe ampelina TaxID=1214573 RepID=A0A0G2HS91_9PEZI|nr:putative c6 zinc finger protein [Diaporthe ampelina]
MTSGTMTTAVKRACDACHRRKVKCDGVNPCRNCHTAQLGCTYHAIPQKKGPKGSRAKVQNRMNGVNAPAAAPTLAPTPGLLTGDIVKECIEFFFANMYPNMPVLSRQRLEQQAVYMEQNLDTYCLLAALSAFMMIQPGMSIPGDPYGLDSMPGANIVSSTVLLEEAIRVRKGYDYTENPTLNTLCTSYFLFACFNGLEMHEKAWFHLREASTMIHIIGMNKEEAYIQFDDVESSRRRRLYWLFFVTERAYALHRNRPVTLQACINPPALGDDPTDHMAHQLNSFIHLSNLFRPFDDAFLGMWSKNRSNWPSAYLNNLHKQLAEIIPAFHSYGDSQLHDLRNNQQWLKTMIWQLNSNSGHGEDQMMFQQYSSNMASNLLAGISSMPQQNSESLNVSFLTKLFDVACSLTDVLALHPASRDPFSPGPREQLNPLLNVLTVLRNGDYRFVPLLISKINETLPKLANPMLQNVPENVATKACNIDIFDGFGNAGMAQPPVLMDDFAMGPNQHTLCTVADFQVLQRANSDISTMSSLGLNNGMGAEMDFMR